MKKEGYVRVQGSCKQAHADPNLPDAFGRTVLHAICQRLLRIFLKNSLLKVPYYQGSAFFLNPTTEPYRGWKLRHSSQRRWEGYHRSSVIVERTGFLIKSLAIGV